ncbi:hypothetical protein [Micromonospora sp. URMC 103]|uniref:hypothetical protein n=1 Tax=Micromonospora sp. URMC 103 TaxID=3423406 RepID=UPI003F19EF3A
MADPIARLRATYGAGPRHVVVLLLCFAVTGWVALRLSGEVAAWHTLLWFVGAVVFHDLVLFPVYASVDRALRGALGVGRRPTGDPSRGAPHRPAPDGVRLALLNHLRAPALAAGLLFLVFLPGLFGWGADTYRAATAEERVPFLARWLALSGALFLVSLGWWAIRWARWRSRAGRRNPPR